MAKSVILWKDQLLMCVGEWEGEGAFLRCNRKDGEDQYMQR